MNDDKRPYVGVGTLTVSTRAKSLVMEALEANRLSYGPMQQKLEREFARLHGCRFGVMSNSGTSALHVAVAALKEAHGWKDGDVVLVPSVTFVATANVVIHNRLVPRFVDVEPDYYGIDPNKLVASITPEVKAVIPVHPFGHPADMDPILDLARSHDLKVIEDSCETMFASYHGRRVGSMGDIGCFSTYVAHLLVTGVGGLSTTNNPDYLVRLRSLINHGRDSIYLSIDDDDDVGAEALRTIIARRFSFVSVGHSFRVTEMEAALGLAQLETWETMIARRRSNARFLVKALSPYQAQMRLPKIRPGCDHSFMMFPIVLRDEEKGDLVHFLETHGVETRDMLPMTNQPVYQSLLGIREEDFPVARWVNRNGFYIGCHQDLTQFELDHIVEVFERYFRRGKRPFDGGGLLALVLSRDTMDVGSILDGVPSELFPEVVAIDAGAPAPALAALAERGVRVVPAAGRNVLEVVRSEPEIFQAESLVLFPVDGRHDERDIARLLLVLERGNDMVVASRFVVGGGRRRADDVVAYRSIGNRVFNLLANLLFFANVSDAFSQFRAIRRSKIRHFESRTEGAALFYHLSLRAIREGWHVAEIPTQESLTMNARDYASVVRSIVPTFTALAAEWIQKRNSRK